MITRISLHLVFVIGAVCCDFFATPTCFAQDLPGAAFSTLCDKCKQLRDVVAVDSELVRRSRADWERTSKARRGSTDPMQQKIFDERRRRLEEQEKLLAKDSAALDACQKKCSEFCPDCARLLSKIADDERAIVKQQIQIVRLNSRFDDESVVRGRNGSSPQHTQARDRAFEVEIGKLKQLTITLEKDRAAFPACLEKCCNQPKNADNNGEVQPPSVSTTPVAPGTTPSPVTAPPPGNASKENEPQGPGPLGPGPLPDNGSRKSKAPPPDLKLQMPPEPLSPPSLAFIPRCDGTDEASVPLLPGSHSISFSVQCAPCAEIVRKYNLAKRQQLCLIQREVAAGKRYAQEVREKNPSSAGTALSADEKKALGKQRLAEGNAYLEPYKQDILKKTEEVKKLSDELWHCNNGACPAAPDVHIKLLPPPKIVPPPLGP